MLLPTLRRPAALAALLLSLSLAPAPACAAPIGAHSASSLSKARAKSDFMRAMKSAVGVGVPESERRRQRRGGDREARANLRRKVAAAAVPASSVPSYRAAAAASSNFAAAIASPAASAAPFARRLEDGGENDDAEGGGAADYADFGFDLADFSLKYAGCSAVATYSDEMAEQEESATVVAARRFVVFRLCPSDYCSDDRTFGCSSDYGEYLIAMDEYLRMLAEYREEKMQRYCEYCEQCMEEDAAEEEEEEQQQQQEEEEEEEQEDDADEDEAEEQDEEGRRRRQRRLDDAEGDDAGDDAAQQQEDGDDDAAANADDDQGQQHACADYDACYNYADVCAEDEDGGEDDDDAELDYGEFFECVEFENENGNGNGNGNGNQYFLGPHCSSDKSTITIGVYSDEDCSVYVGDEVSFYDVTGVAYEEDVMADYYTRDCTSCRESENTWDEVDEDEEDADDINEICENLYAASAKCNRALSDAEDESYYSYNQEANEKEVCYFIENIITGQYDENGYIYLDAEDYANDNKDNRYAHSTSEVSIGQIFGLLFVVLACLVLSVWACFLHRSLTRKAPWRPRRDGNATKAGSLSRQNSGIVMGRSRSGGSYHGGEMT